MSSCRPASRFSPTDFTAMLDQFSGPQMQIQGGAADFRITPQGFRFILLALSPVYTFQGERWLDLTNPIREYLVAYDGEFTRSAHAPAAWRAGPAETQSPLMVALLPAQHPSACTTMD
jgi:hypothetical protein